MKVDTLGIMTLFCRTLKRIYHLACYKFYADLPGYQASVSPLSTVPPHITSTLSRPDLMLVSTDSVMLLELSVVTNTEHHLLAVKKIAMVRYC